MGRMKAMGFKDLSIENRYNGLLDQFLLNTAINHALQKELGAVDRYDELWVDVQKRMLPSYLGIGLKVLKTFSPSRVFKLIVDQVVELLQLFVPLSDVEVSFVSDREAEITVNNCQKRRRTIELVRKAKLDLNPMSVCAVDARTLPKVLEEFGLDVKVRHTRNGCIGTYKLK